MKEQNAITLHVTPVRKITICLNMHDYHMADKMCYRYFSSWRMSISDKSH